MKKKRFILCLFMIMFFYSKSTFASIDDYATLVWEGVVYNSNYYGQIMKIRVTIDGIIGEQMEDGKVKVYERIINKDSKDGSYYIIPIIDGGSIKIEYLGQAEGVTYQDSEMTIGITYCERIMQSEYTEQKVVLNDNLYIDPEEFFSNVDFRYDVNETTPIQYSKININKASEHPLAALIYLPRSESDFQAQNYLQVFSEREAQSMLREIKNGHNTYLMGKTLSDLSSENTKKTFKMEFPEMSIPELEEKYGISINVEEGFWPKDDLLDMMDRIYNQFPEGLIKEMTSYYQSKGIDTTINFQYRETNLGGKFSDEGKGIVINYYPNSINDKFGEPTIAHEMGHFVHKYINDIYGYQAFKEKWISLNDRIGYQDQGFDAWSDEHSKYFVREYGTTNYSEDFATTFEALVGNSPTRLRTMIIEQGDFPLKEKIDLLNKVLLQKSKSITNTDKIWGRALPQEPSTGLKQLYEKAEKIGLIPKGDDFKGLYTSPITRLDFCKLMKNLIEKETNMTLAQFVASKGLKEEWYYGGSISPLGEFKINTNYPFCDVNSAYVFDLYSLGIIDGVSEWRFNPKGTLTKEQVATILYKTASVLEKDLTYQNLKYTDSENISEWAQDSVNYVSSKGIMTNTLDNLFSPKKSMTYEDVYIVIYNFFTKL